MDPVEATDATAKKQADRQAEAYQQAAQVHQDQQKEQKQHSTQRLIDDGKRQAEEAERDKAARTADQARQQTGDPADARARYAQALGESYDIKDPFRSLAKAAMSEYAMFNKQQQDLKAQVAAEADPEKKRMIELRRQIEAHDYMAITHERLAGIGRAISGRDSEGAQQDDIAASRHRARGMELRAERDGRTPEPEKQQQEPKAQAAQRPDKEPSEPADFDAKTGRWNESATQAAPIRNIQHTGSRGHTATKADRIEEARKLYLVSMGKAPAAGPVAGKDAQSEIVARQAEETKQREGLATDQPAETAKASTKEGRQIVTKEAARAAYDAAMRGPSAASFREAGQEATRPSGKGGGKGR